MPRDHTRPSAPLRSPRDIDATVEAFGQQLAATAVERDRIGSHARAERELIRASGLLGLTVPQASGGLGADWPTFYRALRRIAQADSALAHLFGFHHLQLAGITLYGTPEQHSGSSASRSETSSSGAMH